MNARRAVVAVCALFAMGVFLLRYLPTNSPTVAASAESDSPEPLGPLPARAAPQEARSPPPPAPVRDHAAELEAAADVWQFAESAHPDAKSGDARAQYYLARALQYCDDGFRVYFIRRNNRRTLDEAMQWASTRIDLSAEEAREIHGKCSRLKEQSHSFGSAAEWFKASSEGGFALAQMESARRLWQAEVLNPSPTPADSARELKRLAVAALQSGDPQVIFEMGDFAMLLVGEEKAWQEQWVWRLAACQRGFDCGPDAEWLRSMCRFDPNCQPYETGVDFIRRTHSDTFEQIEREAIALGAKLDANDYSFLPSP